MKSSNRRLGRRIMASPLTMCVLAVVFFVIGRATWNLHTKAAASSVKLSQAQRELTDLKQRQQDLSTRVEQLSTSAGIEAE